MGLTKVPGDLIVLENNGVSPGSYVNANITVDSTGRVTSASSGSGVSLSVTGSRASPQSITAGGGVAFTGATPLQTWFVQGSGGPITVTVNPSIAAGVSIGQNLRLIGRSDTNTLTLNDGNGLDLNGSIVLDSNSCIELFWDGTNWTETARR